MKEPMDELRHGFGNTNQSLETRMKEQYEHRARFLLPRRTYTIIRIDGRSFHSFTSGMHKPFSAELRCAFSVAARTLCEEMQGSVFAYLQSDEASFLLTDFSAPQTEAWFSGNVQKLASVSASIFTAAFPKAGATFDSRCFVIPDRVEVKNYFVWRQQDAVRNSIQAYAQSMFSHNSLRGLSCDGLQDKMFREKGFNWNDAAAWEKRGTVVVREVRAETITFTHKITREETTVVADRAHWVDQDAPRFTSDEFLERSVPRALSNGGLLAGVKGLLT